MKSRSCEMKTFVLGVVAVATFGSQQLQRRFILSNGLQAVNTHRMVLGIVNLADFDLNLKFALFTSNKI